MRVKDPKEMGRERGFTLVEVAIAIVIIAVVVMGFFSVFLTGKTGAIRTDAQDISTFLVRQTMDELKNYVSASMSALPAALEGVPGKKVLPGDTCADAWELTGVSCPFHTHRIPAAFLASLGEPYDRLEWRRTYTVVNQAVNGEVLKEVHVSVCWGRPNPPRPSSVDLCDDKIAVQQ